MMTKRKTTYRRLSYNKNDNTYKLTIPPEIVSSNGWGKGQTLYLRNNNGVISYKDKDDPLAKKLKIQYQEALNVYSISCLLYTSDAADEEDSVDLGGRRII